MYEVVVSLAASQSTRCRYLMSMITVRLAHEKEVGFTAVITPTHAACVVCVSGVGRGGHP